MPDGDYDRSTSGMAFSRDPAAFYSAFPVLSAGLLAFAACADEPTSLDTSSSATGADGAGGGGAGDGAGGDLGRARVLFFAAEDDAVEVEWEGDGSPASFALGEARVLSMPVGRDCESGDASCVAFTRSGESSPARLPATTDTLLVHVFAGDSDLDGDVTFDAADVPPPSAGKLGLHYRSLVDSIDYGVLDEGGAFVPFRAGFNQVDVDEQVASYDSDAGIVRVDLPEPFVDGGRYAMVVGEEPGGHFVTYCSLDGEDEACSSFSSDIGG